MSARLMHFISKVADNGDVSALCYRTPKPIPKRQGWTLQRDCVTCAACKSALLALPPEEFTGTPERFHVPLPPAPNEPRELRELRDRGNSAVVEWANLMLLIVELAHVLDTLYRDEATIDAREIERLRTEVADLREAAARGVPQ